MSQNWYCEVFGAELGPLTWSELCELVAHGTLKPTQRVRPEGDRAWHNAADIKGLFAAPAVSDDTDFEIASEAPRAKSPDPPPDDTDFEITVPVSRATVDETDFDVSVPPQRQAGKPEVPADDTDFELGN